MNWNWYYMIFIVAILIVLIFATACQPPIFIPS